MCEYAEYECAEGERVDSVEEQYTVWFAINGHWQGLYVEKERWDTLLAGQELTVERTKYGIRQILWEE